VTVLRNGIDLSRFHTNRDADAVRAELGLPVSAPLAMMISRVVRFKGLEDYVIAAARVSQTLPDVRFLIVGEGYVNRSGGSVSENREYRRELEQLAVRLRIRDRVVFTGFRPDVPRLLNAAAVTVLPSLSEGLSNVVLESMAAGVPVIASRVGGIPEALTDGVTGLLVPPSDPTAVADAMCRVLGSPDLANRLGEAGRRHVTDHFSLDRMVADATGWYLRLLGESRGARRHPLCADHAGFQGRPA
jgi:glycosyltransferase involved in cell wall biosynthesis